MSQSKPPPCKLRTTSFGCRPRGSCGAVLPAPAPQKPHCLQEHELIQIKNSLIAAALLCAAVGAANAAVTINVDQVGSDVVFTSGGSINLAAANFLTSGTEGHGTGGLVNIPGGAQWVGAGLGSSNGAFLADVYTFQLNSRPSASFSSVSVGSDVFATAASGRYWGFGEKFFPDANTGAFSVQSDYVSGTAFSGTSTFAGTTLANLGLVTGSYTWTWGSGAAVDSFTLNIGAVAPVPEPESYALMLAGLGALGAVSRRQRRAR